MFTFPTRIFYMGVPGLVTDCPCGFLVLWINHWPPVCWSTVWKSSLKLDESTETPTSQVNPPVKISSPSGSHSGCVLHQGILTTPVPFVPWQSSLPFLRYNWPWKFKVKGTPVRAASSWFISIVFHIRASYQLPSLSFHDNRASHSQDTIWPRKFKVKGQGQRSRSKVP